MTSSSSLSTNPCLLACHIVQTIDDDPTDVPLFLVRIYRRRPSAFIRDAEENDYHSSLRDSLSPTTDKDIADIEKSSSEEVESWVEIAAKILQEQWPQPHQKVYYQVWMIHHTSCKKTNYGLACSYLLLRPKAEKVNNLNSSFNYFDVIGHGRLTECFESSGSGNATAATYIIISTRFRGLGYGKQLMLLLEQESIRLGYHYVYLWTKTAIPFYIKIGYTQCHRVSLLRPCLKKLSTTSVQSIESMLLKRRMRSSIGNDEPQTEKKMETVTLLPESKQDDDDDDDVWLRKRLVEHVKSSFISTDDRYLELLSFIDQLQQGEKTIQDTQQQKWSIRWNPNIAWQSQIGPSCGLVAIRMIRDYYYNQTIIENGLFSGSRDGDDNQNVSFPSLLSQAQELGYTNDGELFDANDLTSLLQRQLSDYVTPRTTEIYKVKTRDFDSVTMQEMDDNLQRGGVWLLPYDSNPRTKLPTELDGKHAHWGIIVGILYEKSSIINENEGNTLNCEIGDDGKGEDCSGNNEKYSSQITILSDKHCFDNPPSSQCYLCVQHSLSSRWATAPFETWKRSNQQLIFIDDLKFASDTNNKLNLQHKIIQVTVSHHRCN